MNLYEALYGREPRREAEPDGPRPTGLKLLWHVFSRNWWTLVKLNILFWLCCLPLATAPAALKAMTRVCVDLLRGEHPDLWPDWWRAFRGGFPRTTAAGALTAALLFALGFGGRFYGAAMAENGLLAVPTVLLLLAMAVVVMALFSLFPLLEFSELRLGEALRSALLLALVRLPQNLTALGLLLALAALYVLAFPWSSFALGAIALSLFWLTACFAAWPGLEKYVFHIAAEEDAPADAE